MADFELLEPGGHQKLVDEVEDRLDLKADIDGYYAQLTAGAADNLTSRGDAVAAEYLYRTSGGTADIETGQATIKSIKGNTLRWNQLNSRMNNAQQVAGLTRTINDDGSLTITGTASEDPNFNTLYLGNTISLKRDGRKYLFKASKPTGLNLRISGHNTTGQGQSFIWSSNIGTNWDGALCAYCEAGTEVNITNLKCMVIDLTTMFGAGSEPSTIEEFEALYPQSYYPYDAGSLLPVQMEGIETTGFNQWDEQTAEGIWNNDGTMSGSSAYICCKNKIPVFPGQTYYLQRPAAVTNVYMKGYDANGINGISLNLPGTNLLTIPSGVYFITFAVAKSQYGTTYNHDICINLSWSGRRNGEYEPYWTAQRLIAAGTLRSAGSVYDEQTATEHITRVGVVAMNAVTWMMNTAGIFFLDETKLPMLRGANTGIVLSCSAYTPINSVAGAGSMDSAVDMTIAAGSIASPRIYVKDTRYATADEFNAATTDALIFYPLATPTVTPIDPPLNLTYKVDDWGTERVMVPTGEMSAPPVMEVAYGLNVVDFVRRAPTQYISAASFAQYLLARDSHDGTTTAMEWDETNGRYEFTITDTVTEG